MGVCEGRSAPALAKRSTRVAAMVACALLSAPHPRLNVGRVASRGAPRRPPHCWARRCLTQHQPRCIGLWSWNGFQPPLGPDRSRSATCSSIPLGSAACRRWPKLLPGGAQLHSLPLGDRAGVFGSCPAPPDTSRYARYCTGGCVRKRFRQRGGSETRRAQRRPTTAAEESARASPLPSPPRTERAPCH